MVLGRYYVGFYYLSFRWDDKEKHYVVRCQEGNKDRAIATFRERDAADRCAADLNAGSAAEPQVVVSLVQEGWPIP